MIEMTKRRKIVQLLAGLSLAIAALWCCDIYFQSNRMSCVLGLGREGGVWA